MLVVLLVDVCHLLLDIVHVGIHLVVGNVQLLEVLIVQDDISHICRDDCAKCDAGFVAMLVVVVVEIRSGS